MSSAERTHLVYGKASSRLIDFTRRLFEIVGKEEASVVDTPMFDVENDFSEFGLRMGLHEAQRTFSRELTCSAQDFTEEIAVSSFRDSTAAFVVSCIAFSAWNPKKRNHHVMLKHDVNGASPARR